MTYEVSWQFVYDFVLLHVSYMYFIPWIIMLLFYITNISISQFAILLADILQKCCICYLHVIHSTIQDITHSY